MAGPIRWFVHNPIAANLLMMLIIFGGLMGIPALDKQFFPDFELDYVSVSMPYLGAGPKEVEEQICLRIEEAIHDLNGVKELRATARQGIGTVIVEAESGYNMQRLIGEIKSRVDAVTSFPAEAERPIVTELAHRHHMMTVSVAGDIGERNLKELGESLRDEMSNLPHVSVVDMRSPRPYELSIEVSELVLRRYGLRFDDVVNAIRSSSLNLPAGSIKADSGDIQLQTRGQAYDRADFENIVLVSKRDGTRILLGDVATIRDGFADEDMQRRLNGMPSLNLHVYVTSNPNVLKTSAIVQNWVADVETRLPPGVQIDLWRDSAVPFKGRVQTLLGNGLGGLALVYLLLLVFLRPLLAMWVCVGIMVAFLGCFWILPYTGVSLNMISLFAFLLILGIIVDDAIIVGESIHTHQELGEPGSKGAINGTHGVVKPVLFAVISTMIFFVPLMFLPGELSQVAASIPIVVILALFFSLIECLWILPSHLANMRPLKPAGHPLLAKLEILRERCADSLLHFAARQYRPFLERCLRNNLLSLSFFFVALSLSMALYGGGWLRSAFFPTIVSDFVEAEIELQEGGSFADTLAVLERVESAAVRLKQRYNSVEELNQAGPAVGNIDSEGSGSSVLVRLELGNDDLSTKVFARQWREEIGELGELGDVEEFQMDYTINDAGKPIRLVLASPSTNDLQAVSDELRGILLRYPGVYNVNDTLQSPKDEIELDLKPAAENLGITLAELARQVRRAFYGAEAQRIPRAREDVKVMVRYPEDERLSVESLNEMRIRTPDGREVPFETVAEVRFVPGYLTIKRLNRKRTLEMTAEVADGTSSPRAVVNKILEQELPRWKANYPGLSLALDGELQEEDEFSQALLQMSGVAMLAIYALMAVVFRSYWQPILILTAVPFGLMGAIIGHMLLDWQVSMFSMLGVAACAGVVVNDNLVLIDRINQLRGQGRPVLEALSQAGQDRFRPIILTSLTTFVGLLPIMFETSMQAQFLIPMVISLAFGVLFATGVTLILVPGLYLLGERFQERVLGREPAPVESGISPSGQRQ
jgi:multidrug efflux pump subunit AcrB